MKSYKNKVEFYDVDSMNVVWHGNYVKFLEKARCEFLKDLGYDYKMMKKDGFVYPVVKMDLKFIKPLFFEDEFEVKVKLLQIHGFLKFRYEIFNQKNEKVCLATSSQVCVRLSNKESLYEAPKRLQELTKEILCER